MNARDAASLCSSLHARVRIPIHYSFTGGPEADRVLLKYSGTAEEFAKETARVSPATQVHILSPGEPLTIHSSTSATSRDNC